MSLLLRRRVAQKTSSKIPLDIYVWNYGIYDSPAVAAQPYIERVESNGTTIDDSTMATFEHPWSELFYDPSVVENMAYYGDYDHTYDQWYDITLHVDPDIGGPGSQFVYNEVYLFAGVRDLTINEGDDPSTLYEWYIMDADGGEYDFDSYTLPDDYNGYTTEDMKNAIMDNTYTDYYDGAGPGTYNIYTSNYEAQTDWSIYHIQPITSTLTVN